MVIQLFMEIRVVPIRLLSTWLFSCSTGLFVYYVKYIRLFNLILFCYFDFYMIQYHRHIFKRTTNFCPPTKLLFCIRHILVNLCEISKEKKVNEDKLILGLFVSFYLYFYLLLMLNFMHHDILSKAFSVNSLTVKFKNQLNVMTKNKYFSLIMNLK